MLQTIISHTAAVAFAMIVTFASDLQPAAAQPAAPTASQVAIDGTEFVVTTSDNRVLRSRDLVGATLNTRFGGRPMRLRIASVEPDPDDRTGTVWLHGLETPDASGAWANFCSTGPDGRAQGFPLAGGPKGPELSCTSGAIAKCVRFGYRRWTTGANGASLEPLHAACVHMVRGDYGGVDRPWTRDGMRIDVYDDRGIQKPENTPGDAFEAGWTRDGAVCVRHVRVKENASLNLLESLYPSLRGRIGSVCTEEFARANGAVIFNRSAP